MDIRGREIKTGDESSKLGNTNLKRFTTQQKRNMLLKSVNHATTKFISSSARCVKPRNTPKDAMTKQAKH